MTLPTPIDTFVQSITEPVLIVDGRGQVLDGNDAARREFGDEVPLERVEYRVVDGHIEPDELTADGGSTCVYLDAPPEAMPESAFLDGGDQMGYYSVTGAMVPSAEDRHALILQSVDRPVDEDIDLMRRHETYKQVIDSAGHGFMITDVSGRIQYVNSAFEEITGFSREEARGERPSILSSGEHAREFYATLWSDILSGEVWSNEIINRHQDGRLIHIDHTIAPIEGADGIVGFVAIFTEVTRDTVRSDQLDLLYRILRHNLRTETTKIQGYADLIETTSGESSIEGFAETIDRSARKLARLSETAQTVKQSLQESDFETATDIGWALCSQSRTLDDRDGVSVSVTAPEDPVPVNGLVDIGTKEVLINAVSHANRIDIEISAELTVMEHDGGRWAHIEISDNGPGIPPEEKAVLEQGIETPLLHSEGLGLWLINRVTQIAGGTVRVESDDSIGTTVAIETPIVETDRG